MDNHGNCSGSNNTGASHGYGGSGADRRGSGNNYPLSTGSTTDIGNYKNSDASKGHSYVSKTKLKDMNYLEEECDKAKESYHYYNDVAKIAFESGNLKEAKEALESASQKGRVFDKHLADLHDIQDGCKVPRTINTLKIPDTKTD